MRACITAAAGRVGSLNRSVDDCDLHPRLAQRAPQCQSGWTGPDHEDLDLFRQHVASLWRRRVDHYRASCARR